MSELFDLSGKVALVTGGSRGLGREMVLAFARAGADVVVTSRDLEACERVAAEVEALGRRAWARACHVGRWEEIDRLVDAVYEDPGRIDVLVNNAGMSPLAPSLAETSEDLFDKVVAVNFKGPFRLGALVGRRMAETGGGSIVNVSSTGSLMPQPGFGPYACAKAALNTLTAVLALEYGPTVRVNTLCPGPFLTDVSRHWPEEDADHRAQRNGAARPAGGGRDHRPLPGQPRLELHHGGTRAGGRGPVLMVEDLRDRASAAAQRWHAGVRVTQVEPLTGGSSSLTFVAHVEAGPAGDEVLVLKVAPPGLPPVRNRDVLRQGRVLRALHGAGIVVPPVCFDDPGHPPDVPPFIAMGFVPGTSVEPVLAGERDPAAFAEIRARALDAAAVLAAIHGVDVGRAGLGGEAAVGLVDEVDRWSRAFSTVPPDLHGEYRRCADALVAASPPPLRPGVNHGDYRLGNTLGQAGRVTAVIDWEIWSIGDPRVDLAWFTFFTDEAGHPAASSAAPSGMPTAAELLDAYSAAGGAVLDDLRWFDALTRYKEAAATALLIKRARRDGELAPALARMVPALPRLLDEAHQLLGGRA